VLIIKSRAADCRPYEFIFRRLIANRYQAKKIITQQDKLNRIKGDFEKCSDLKVPKYT
jgi:hypothetical protein